MNTRLTSLTAAAALALAAAACGGGAATGDGGAAGTGGGAAGTGGGAAGTGGSAGAGAAGTTGTAGTTGAAGESAPPDPKLQRGEIRVIEGIDGFKEDPAKPAVTLQPYGRLDAHFESSAAPVWHTEVMTNGTCTLEKFLPEGQCPGDFCDGVCLGGQCQPFATYVDVGTVRIDALKLAVTMNASEYGNYYYLQNVAIPSDLYTPGATITAHIAGKGAIPKLDLSAAAPNLFTTSITGHELKLAAHTDAVVTWTPGSVAGARVRLTLNANNKAHGQPYEAIITCEVADAAGTLTVPKAMVDAFPATLNWQFCVSVDCPRSTVQRLTRGVATLPDAGGAWIGLTLINEVSFGVVHAL